MSTHVPWFSRFPAFGHHIMPTKLDTSSDRVKIKAYILKYLIESFELGHGQLIFKSFPKNSKSCSSTKAYFLKE